jgi:hypothetical protein
MTDYDVPLFVPVTEHQALLDRLADRATPVDAIGNELQALRCLRENVEALMDELDNATGSHDDMDDAVKGVKAALAELRAIDEGTDG